MINSIAALKIKLNNKCASSTWCDLDKFAPLCIELVTGSSPQLCCSIRDRFAPHVCAGNDVSQQDSFQSFFVFKELVESINWNLKEEKMKMSCGYDSASELLGVLTLRKWISWNIFVSTSSDHKCQRFERTRMFEGHKRLHLGKKLEPLRPGAKS